MLMEGLSRCLRFDQHLVGDRPPLRGDAKEGAEGGVARPATVEAENEFVEVGLAQLQQSGQAWGWGRHRMGSEE